MNTTEEKIQKLKDLIASPETPEGLRESMSIKLKALEKTIKPKKKPVDLSGLPHARYMADNNIQITDIPMPIRKKINGLRMFMGKDSEKVRASANGISENIVAMIKEHLTPPEPPKPERIYTDEEKEQLAAEYKARKNKRKESGYY